MVEGGKGIRREGGLSRRPSALRRTWLFVAGADREAQIRALEAGADVLVPDLEDFTPPEMRPQGRELIVALMDACRQRGIIAAVRINPLEGDGPADLAAVMRGRPDCVLLPKTVKAASVVSLERELIRFEIQLGIAHGHTEIVPNIETAAGLVAAGAIAVASHRISACMVATEDMAADLGAERGRDGIELHHVRSRFLIDCTAAGVVAIDSPYTFSDVEGAQADARFARRLGYRSKSAVLPSHVQAINAVLTPGEADVAQARRFVDAFETARAAGKDRVEVDGSLVEVPTYTNAKRLIVRYEALRRFEPS